MCAASSTLEARQEVSGKVRKIMVCAVPPIFIFSLDVLIHLQSEGRWNLYLMVA